MLGWGRCVSPVFQSTLPRKERRCTSKCSYSIYQFQSTLPRKERRYCKFFIGVVIYFNPRSHERSDMPFQQIFQKQTLFQSTLPRKERHGCQVVIRPKVNFNPRSHERSDMRAWYSARGVLISIHAPTKGATAFLQLT